MGMQFETDLEKLYHVLGDSKKPMGLRFDALFQLRSNGSVEAMGYIAKCLESPEEDSALLKHELAYCIGQMQLKEAIPVLSRVLQNEQENSMVRHEAGEALGAIGDNSAVEILTKFVSHKEAAISETCELALERIRNVERSVDQNRPTGGFGSIDPAVFAESESNGKADTDTDEAVDALQQRLTDEALPLYERYVAMFKLRNINSSKSTKALCKGFKCGSALFRHEIAYVLGQMQTSDCVDELTRVLADRSEDAMVRHECAEALGSIASKHEAVANTLRQFLNDPERVVRESCEVALEISSH